MSDLTPVSATNGYGPVERDMSNGGLAAGDGRTITLNGVTYPKGLGVHAASTVVYSLAGGYQSFAADVGVDDECGTAGTVVFQVIVDGVKLFDSGTMTNTVADQTGVVNTTGKNQLRLVVTNAGDGKRLRPRRLGRRPPHLGRERPGPHCPGRHAVRSPLRTPGARLSRLSQAVSAPSSTCSRNRRISAARKRRCPPRVRIAEILPARAQRVTVFGFTRNMAATSEGVSRASGSFFGSIAIAVSTYFFLHSRLGLLRGRPEPARVSLFGDQGMMRAL